MSLGSVSRGLMLDKRSVAGYLHLYYFNDAIRAPGPILSNIDQICSPDFTATILLGWVCQNFVT